MLKAKEGMTLTASLIFLCLLLPLAELVKVSTLSPDPKSPEPLRCYVCDSSENKECGSEDTTVLKGRVSSFFLFFHKSRWA